MLAQNWSLATALSLLVWYIFAPQCASTLAVIKRETGGWTWMWVTFGYMLALAYAGAFAHLPDRRPARRRIAPAGNAGRGLEAFDSDISKMR